MLVHGDYKIIYDEYESVPRITVWHHEGCRVMTNGDLEERILIDISAVFTNGCLGVTFQLL